MRDIIHLGHIRPTDILKQSYNEYIRDLFQVHRQMMYIIL